MSGEDQTEQTRATKRKWENINAPREERPLIQNYSGIDELPPIPISFPQQGAIGPTGDWRTYRPVITLEKCTGCGQCYLYCPEGVVSETATGSTKFQIDYIYCKGCGICAKVCPAGAIDMHLEAEEEH
jgi:2-oxoacid:acceptor oxidoreductase delta subunit (pyruvate/2-ketoisovalerate family)